MARSLLLGMSTSSETASQWAWPPQWEGGGLSCWKEDEKWNDKWGTPLAVLTLNLNGNERVNTREKTKKLHCLKPVSWEISSKFHFAFKIFLQRQYEGALSLRRWAQESATYWLCDLRKLLNFSVHRLFGVWTGAIIVQVRCPACSVSCYYIKTSVTELKESRLHSKPLKDRGSLGTRITHFNSSCVYVCSFLN